MMFNHCPREIFESSKNDPALIDRRFLQVLNGHSQIRPSTTFLSRKTISVPHWHRCLELKKVNTRAFESALANYQGESVRELEQTCRKSLRRYMPLMSTMRREGQLLPLKFEQRFYEWSFTCYKNGSFRSHHVFKSQWPIIKINW